MLYNWHKIVENAVWSNKKIIIAGGTGFIGKRVVSLLISLNAQVFVITRNKNISGKNITYLNVDLNNKSELERYRGKEKFDMAIYLAAKIPFLNGKKESYVEAKYSTFDPLINFCDCFIQDTKKFVFASSIDAAGICEIPEYGEEISSYNVSAYGLAKYCGELYAKKICEENSCRCIILRFSQVYGLDEPEIKIIPMLKRALNSGTEFRLFTDGKERRKYLYVDDAVQAIFRSLLSDETGTYNIAGKEAISMNELIKLMEEIWRKKLFLNRLNRKKGKNNLPGIQKAQKELEFQPEVSIEQGLRLIKN